MFIRLKYIHQSKGMKKNFNHRFALHNVITVLGNEVLNHTSANLLQGNLMMHLVFQQVPKITRSSNNLCIQKNYTLALFKLIVLQHVIKL